MIKAFQRMRVSQHFGTILLFAFTCTITSRERTEICVDLIRTLVTNVTNLRPTCREISVKPEEPIN